MKKLVLFLLMIVCLASCAKTFKHRGHTWKCPKYTKLHEPALPYGDTVCVCDPPVLGYCFGHQAILVE